VARRAESPSRSPCGSGRAAPTRSTSSLRATSAVDRQSRRTSAGVVPGTIPQSSAGRSTCTSTSEFNRGTTTRLEPVRPAATAAT